MAIHVALHHKTEYTYDRPVALGPQIIRLRPAPHCRTPIISYSLKLEPKDHFLNWAQDPQGNFMARMVTPEPTRKFSVTVDLVADMQVINPFDFFLEDSAQKFPFEYESWLDHELRPYLKATESGPLLMKWIDSVPRDIVGTVDFVAALNHRLEQEIDYTIRMEPGVQTPEETLQKGSGSCRDSSWLLVQILRHLGLAARFCSGYLIQLKPDVEALDGPTGTDHDFTDLHAWAEVYLPGAGWFGLDPTSGLATGEGHIPLAATPDPFSAAPISGKVGFADVDFKFDMSVKRIYESPRVTKPYTEDQWHSIDALGQAVDAKLAEHDVRLTMGGEPTFVSIDDMEADEWNTAAVGPTKRAFADEMIRRLRDRFAPGGMLHHGQGKWYPGESLPRWAFSLFWRKDGEPVWSHPDLIALEDDPREPVVDDAGTFLMSLAKKLEIEEDYVVPAYEDPMTYIGKEQGLPENVDPLDSKLDDPEERARLARVFSHGLTNATGYVLPIQAWNAPSKSGHKHKRKRWRTQKWPTRRGGLFLVPGDSPCGFRLPLKALPHIEPNNYPYIVPADPFDEFPSLSDPGAGSAPDAEEAQATQASVSPEASEGQNAQDVVAQELTDNDSAEVRTAIAIEPRDGKLCIFMPPTERLEDYLDLLAMVEKTAVETGLPVHLEGYMPPKDPRINLIQVTPDPGVIEVNIHPANDWTELSTITRAIYEEARLTRLGTEKFMIDGRHTGTGGGNHLVLGARRAPDSPFLRRPDLLRSLVNYWQNHPSLSYLFSGLFIGPTSQAPRMDEARHESLYEMEIAFDQIPDPTDLAGDPHIRPWLVDRAFRNLLVDVTGNTHRAEICIDKLYSPDGPTGRLGLVEFRAFEMPPHPEMSLAQQLLLRALVARFWEAPYRAKLVQWGTRLHDRFMLPHFVWQDFCDIIEDLQNHGYDLKPEWFAPHFEFRFPLYGSVNYRGVEVEIRHALEPWHVLGEQGAIGGTVRFVDSSLERLQIKARGLDDGRYVIACNGRRLPMTATGVQDESVSGVRYRAWQPSSCLHPTIKVHAPLTFDVIDTWNRRSIGGCSYHVAHPGGRNFETFPVNSYEAEGRRLARFLKHGHTPGTMEAPRAEPNADYPMTLDLRRTPPS